MRHILVIIMAFTLSTVLGAESPSLQVPEIGESPDAIRNALRPFKGFGYIQSAEFTDGARRSFSSGIAHSPGEPPVFSTATTTIPKARNGYVS